jgi:hypothetical protein
MNDILLYTASVVIILWGIAHIIPTRSVVNSFGTLSEDNRQIITMEWVAEGLVLSFIGLLVLIVTIWGGRQDAVSVIVYRACALMLITMAGWTAVTGAKTSIVAIKICPFVKTATAIMFFLGSFL